MILHNKKLIYLVPTIYKKYQEIVCRKNIRGKYVVVFLVLIMSALSLMSQLNLLIVGCFCKKILRNLIGDFGSHFSKNRRSIYLTSTPFNKA